MRILVTGAIGFIGFHLVNKLLETNHDIIGIDNINGYYNVKQKYDKLPLFGINNETIWSNQLLSSSIYPNFKFSKIDITDRYQVEKLFQSEHIEVVINLAAQAGVQYSIQNPHSYISNNITGFINLIDASKEYNVKHFIYASSSSVYGNRQSGPFSENDTVDKPISLYAASKKANELIAHTYSHLHNLRTTGLRFFTVYGPWGRPDMAPFIFTKNIIENKEIVVYNNGELERDFTYVDDIVEGIYSLLSDNNLAALNYSIYNIGNADPINLMSFINEIELKLNKKALISFQPLREGDVYKTYASIDEISRDFGYCPKTSVKTGISNFVDWYIDYFNV